MCVCGRAGVSEFFSTMNLKIIFFFWGGGRGGGRVGECFLQRIRNLQK